eukprot:TRINITY_DN55320_c0_g1_i1.p1 TRINITY_DN55320_c0_g1~~TRINITY_DN55320_c0_g1_i1.p1  ORF type:complete len:432 (+),score=54.72 TRINITY_DN55320_c0_g1_i1:106-1401(+)
MMRSRSRQGDVCEKPHRVDMQALRGHAISAAGQAPAGDVVGAYAASVRSSTPQATPRSNSFGRGRADLFGCGGSSNAGSNAKLSSLAEAERKSGAPLLKEMESLMSVDQNLDVRQRRDEVRYRLQELMANSVNSLAASNGKITGPGRHGGDRSLTPSRNSREALRYHASMKQREAPAPAEASYHSRQDCRYHEPPRPLTRTRSLTPEGGSFRRHAPAGPPSSAASDAGAGAAAAGRETNSRMRHDTPGGQAASLGRTRSLTPDYYRRYATNLAGSSLPGSTAAAAEVGAQKTPRPAYRAAACDPKANKLTASAVNQQSLRFFGSKDEDGAPGKRHLQASPISLQDSKQPLTPRRRGYPSLRSEGSTNALGGGGSPASTSWHSFGGRAPAGVLSPRASEIAEEGGKSLWSSTTGTPLMRRRNSSTSRRLLVA